MMQGGSTTDAQPGFVTDVAQTWRTQRLSFEIAGVSRVSVTADPRTAAPETLGPQADVPPVPFDDGCAGPDQAQHPPVSTGIGAEVSRVIANERARDELALPGEVVLIPALGPVIPTSAPVVPTVEELEDSSILAIDAPPPEGPEPLDPADPSDLPSALDPVDPAGPPEGAEDALPEPVRRDDRKWLRSQQVLQAVWGPGVVTGSGALIASDRSWFEPAVAIMREADVLGSARAGEDVDLVEIARCAARETGQVAIVHVHDGVLDVLPTGTDPRVPHLQGLPTRASRWPGMCPLTGVDELRPCRAEGGPGGEEDIRARLAFDARRALAVGLLGCGVCHGRGRTDDGQGNDVDVPLPLALSLGQIPRITLRTGETIEIDALADIYAAGEPF
ncbi:hypothetical protein I8D64_09760 [Brachybacterium sp. MASK1Z-5]|uniref:DUF222 domain-containing protein n=1 Tax=Brachybacterium halotolerans TaxID=2795215 RepID=A0ABS1BAP8_9MICO|nr:hypothetical protein [Brachybacterium halotolerans]MBK0331688.1 hypothetical protein [Brachybacterium halotolerans]